jgi:hypothetical protein
MRIKDCLEHGAGTCRNEDLIEDLLAALESLKHGDGCYCAAAFAMDGAHPSHSDECRAACRAIEKAGGGSE